MIKRLSLSNLEQNKFDRSRSACLETLSAKELKFRSGKFRNFTAIKLFLNLQREQKVDLKTPKI